MTTRRFSRPYLGNPGNQPRFNAIAEEGRMQVVGRYQVHTYLKVTYSIRFCSSFCFTFEACPSKWIFPPQNYYILHYINSYNKFDWCTVNKLRSINLLFSGMFRIERNIVRTKKSSRYIYIVRTKKSSRYIRNKFT